MNFAALFSAADAAGKAAAQAAKPTPMVVGEPTSPFGNKIDYAKPVYYVADGVCGFAWVSFAGNTAFGRWARKAGLAKPAYPKGLQIWVRDYGQSMQLKEAYAEAFAAELRKAGVDAWAGSRMD